MVCFEKKQKIKFDYKTTLPYILGVTGFLSMLLAADSPWRPWRHRSVANPTAMGGGAREGTTAAARMAVGALGGQGTCAQAPPALQFPGTVSHRLP